MKIGQITRLLFGKRIFLLPMHTMICISIFQEEIGFFVGLRFHLYMTCICYAKMHTVPCLFEDVCICEVAFINFHQAFLGTKSSMFIGGRMFPLQNW